MLLFHGDALPIVNFDSETLNRPLHMPSLKSFRLHGNAITVQGSSSYFR